MEHAQGIIYNECTGTYELTEILDGGHDSVSFTPLLVPRRTGLVALVHSHPYCTGHIPDEFSSILVDSKGVESGDWFVCSNRKVNMYLASPTGSLMLMRWDMDGYNFSVIHEDLPVDNSMYDCLS